MIVGLAGPTMTLEPGDERDFPQDEAVRLIKSGFAVPVAESPIERAIASPAPEVRADMEAVDNARHRRRHKGRR